MGEGRAYLKRTELVGEIERRFAAMSAKEEPGGSHSAEVRGEVEPQCSPIEAPSASRLRSGASVAPGAARTMSSADASGSPRRVSSVFVVRAAARTLGGRLNEVAPVEADRLDSRGETQEPEGDEHGARDAHGRQAHGHELLVPSH
jgi:hypothetical protein